MQLVLYVTFRFLNSPLDSLQAIHQVDLTGYRSQRLGFPT